MVDTEAMPGKKYIGLEIFFNGKPECKLAVFPPGVYRVWMKTIMSNDSSIDGMYQMWFGPKYTMLPTSTFDTVPGFTIGHWNFALQGFSEQLYHTHPSSQPTTAYDVFHIPRGKHLWAPARTQNVDCFSVGMMLVATPIYVDANGFVPLDVPLDGPKVAEGDISTAEKANLTFAGFFWQGFPTQWISYFLEDLQIKEGKAEVFIVDCRTGVALASSTGFTAVNTTVRGGTRAVPTKVQRWDVPLAIHAKNDFVKQVSRDIVAALGLKSDWSNFPSRVDLSVGKQDDGRLDEEIIVVATRVSEKYRVDWAVIVAVSKADVLSSLDETNMAVFGAILAINAGFKLFNLTVLPIVVVLLLIVHEKISGDDDDGSNKTDTEMQSNKTVIEKPRQEERRPPEKKISFGNRVWSDSTRDVTKKKKHKMTLGMRSWSKGLDDATRPDDVERGNSSRLAVLASTRVVPLDEEDERIDNQT